MTDDQSDVVQDVDDEITATEITITEEELDEVSGGSLPIPRLLNP